MTWKTRSSTPTWNVYNVAARASVLPKDRLLQQIGALTDEGKPTVSGLLFGKDPQLFMPHSRAIFVKFSDTQPRGPEGAFGYGRREEFTGPLPRIIDRAWRVIWEEMDKQAVVKGLHRQEQTEYPQSSVREALVNAVAHRDYRLTGRSIEVRMYTDRLEVTSPGGLPAHITLDNIVEEHYSRNPRGQRHLPVGLHRRIGTWRRPYDRRHGQRRPSAPEIRGEEPPFFRDSVQYQGPRARRTVVGTHDE